MTDVDPANRSRESAPPFPPPGLAERLERVLPPENLKAFLEDERTRSGTCFRVNTLKSSVKTILERMNHASIHCTPSEWCDEAIVADAPVRRLQEVPGWEEGDFHIQSASSIAAALVLDPKPGEWVLDLCAAPGSKTSHLAALMKNEGRLVANDLSRSRAHRLRAVLKLLGARATVRVGPGERAGLREPETYDRVLVDAPCSGEGMMRRGQPETWSNWKPKTPARLSSRQKSLLHAAIDAVKPGGTVVYSTCTFAPEENELVINRALDVYEGRIRLEPIELDLPGRLPGCLGFKQKPLPARPEVVRLAPPEMDGFFIARFLKTG